MAKSMSPQDIEALMPLLRKLAQVDDRIVANHARGILIHLATAQDIPTIAA